MAGHTSKTESKIPEFLENGNLPPGIHSVSWSEFKEKYGIGFKRKQQLAGLEKAIGQFKQAGCTKIYVDGSFVTNKKNPGDFDALYDLDEVNVNNIDNRLLDGTLQGREIQKRYYEGEFFPASYKAMPFGPIYLDFFQQDKRSKQPKGIVKIELG